MPFGVKNWVVGASPPQVFRVFRGNKTFLDGVYIHLRTPFVQGGSTRLLLMLPAKETLFVVAKKNIRILRKQLHTNGK